jgi:hypothetical protein
MMCVQQRLCLVWLHFDVRFVIIVNTTLHLRICTDSAVSVLPVIGSKFEQPIGSRVIDDDKNVIG